MRGLPSWLTNAGKVSAERIARLRDGKQKILQLRASATQTLGARFDIKAFHDCVLTNGSTPLTVLERIVNDWAAQPQHA